MKPTKDARRPLRAKTKKSYWFGVRGLLESDLQAPAGQRRYEESFLIVRADSEEHAEKKARRVFRSQGWEFHNRVETCYLFDEPAEGAEVYWTMRLSSLTPAQYVKKHWGDGKPRSCRSRGWRHHWFNHDGKHSGCYNCHEVRAGQLWKGAVPK